MYLTIKSLKVTRELYVLPTQYTYVFLWISEQTEIILIYTVNFYNRDGRFYREVQTKPLNIIYAIRMI
jgi:hypothetical protein